MASPDTSRRPQEGKKRLIERAIAALLSKSTISSAAKECGLSKRTLQRWLQAPEFQEQFREAKCAVLREATSRLTANSVRAAEVLKKVFDNSKAPPGARVTAAVNTLKLSLDAYAIEELEDRLRKLEGQNDAL